jgi:glycosyltransferase involved in cell wall biosynthesis
MNTALVLNWNELEVSKDSVRRLLKEPDLEVVVVDNGSDDGSKEYFKSLGSKIKFVDLPKNMGSSVGRNKGIEVAKGKNIFLLDGDILFVKGTIAEYQKILDMYPDAYCVGQNSMELLNKLGHNGSFDIMDADMSMGTDYEVSDWFPQAWTQFALFRGDLLRKVRFYDEGVFGEAGYGFDDDDLHHEMTKLGYVSLACSLPIYYHFAHGGWRELGKQNKDDNMKQRKKLFEKRWGKNSSFGDILSKGNITKTYRKSPNDSRL